MAEKDNKSSSPLSDSFFNWRLEKVEEESKLNKTEIEKLKDRTYSVEKKTGELSIYITQILNTVEDISDDFKNLDDLSSKRHETQQEKWIGLFQKVTYLVIGAIITYFFSQLR